MHAFIEGNLIFMKHLVWQCLTAQFAASAVVPSWCLLLVFSICMFSERVLIAWQEISGHKGNIFSVVLNIDINAGGRK